MNYRENLSKFISLVLVIQLAIPLNSYGQSSSTQPPAAPEAVRPYLIVDGLRVSDEESLHLPIYRAHLIRAFNEQQQLQLVDYNQVLQWKSKYTFNEQNVNDTYLVKARNSLAAGKKSYENIEYEQARDDLSAAKKEFIVNLSHLRSNRDLLEAHLYLGMTYIALASDKKKTDLLKLAQSEFEKVVMLDPQRELSPRSYSPEVITMFDNVKRKLTSNNRITVTIDANVPQAKVYLNGKLLGPTPIKTRLIPGDYYFLAERKGMKSWSDLIKLRNPVEHITANMQSSRENADWNGMFQIREGNDQQTTDMGEVVTMSKSVGGEIVFLATLEDLDHQTRLLGQLYDVRTQEYSQVAIADVGRTPEDHAHPDPNVEPAAYDLAKALATMIRPDGYLINSGQSLMGVEPSRIVPQQAAKVEEHQAPDAKLYQYWWFWAGIVIIGVGGYYAVNKYVSPTSSDITVNNKGNF